jgi:hypothetical protein
MSDKVVGTSENLDIGAISKNTRGCNGAVIRPEKVPGIVSALPVKVAKVKGFAGTGGAIMDTEIIAYRTKVAFNDEIGSPLGICWGVRDKSVRMVECRMIPKTQRNDCGPDD